MKKYLLTIIAFFLISNLEIKAQTEYGIKTGLNISKYTGDLFAEYNYRVGFYGGGFVNIRMNEKFKIQSELLFAQQGTDILIEDVEIRESPDQIPIIGDFKSKVIESTISIPILAQYYLADKIYVEAGPQFGFIIDREEEVTESPVDDPSFNNISDFDYDKFDLGLSLGAGYELSERLTLNLRYYFGLIGRDFQDVKLSVFNLGIEYRL
ncbi:porin family protein [Psychroflexus aestuariivivens]|uniref:porin family protein n=1 Tax=Psychroflexus aestuariivivens TaxID=1795040 RepID=UPI000FDBB0DB|nr:porin family protein [Psychroflexus aestuariivivens]